MKDLIEMVGSHARACARRMRQLDVELNEIHHMKRDREHEHARLQNQLMAARSMLQTIRNDLPEGPCQEAVDKLLARLDHPEAEDPEDAPAWDEDDEVGVTERSWRRSRGSDDGPKMGMDF